MVGLAVHAAVLAAGEEAKARPRLGVLPLPCAVNADCDVTEKWRTRAQFADRHYAVGRVAS